MIEVLAGTAPTWLKWVVDGSTDPLGSSFLLHRAVSAVVPAREAAVLILFGGNPDASNGVPEDADVLLLQRATTLRQHSGQVAFPGGGADPEDDGPVSTALREAQEETGLDPAGVEPLALLSPIFVPPSRFNVTPVIGYWRAPSPVHVVDHAESQRVLRVPLSTLIDPANRFQVRGPLGFQSPAFDVDGMVVWGFTGGLLAALLTASGWEMDWDHSDIRDLTAVLGKEHR